MSLLNIRNLKATIQDKPILRGVNLDIVPGKVHAIMGPNGSGKSTLANVIAGNEVYEVADGTVTYGGEDLLTMAVEERAQRGIFMAFQYPVEIPGVVLSTFLRQVVNDLRQLRGKPVMDPITFVRWTREIAKDLAIDDAILARSLNAGLSGGEKKRSEVLQMVLMDPQLVIMDETDSGLDVDALKIVARAVDALRNEQRSFLVVTHYRRLLDYLRPDVVHVMVDGTIRATGDFSLVERIEAHGYEAFRNMSAPVAASASTISLASKSAFVGSAS